MPRSQHKYHFIYKTTNIKNGKYYIGMHSTSNLDDGYLGSGNKIRRSIRKYGKENFKLEILQFFESRELLAEREKELVNEEILKDPMCMNLRKGGEGGWHKWANLAFKQKLEDPEYKKWFIEKTGSKETFRRLFKEGKIKPYDWTGRKHKQETIEKFKVSKINHGIGENNSQFGTMWITNGKENKKIKKENIILEGWYKGRSL
jgi:hypothetical protein